MINFFVPGPPKGKGRPRFGRTNDGHVVTYTPKETKEYEQFIRLCYWQNAHGKKPTEKPVAIRITICHPIPKSIGVTKYGEYLAGTIRPTVKPDADNVTKIVMDALNELAWADDKQVVDIRASKYYSDQPGLLVEIDEIGN